MNSPRQLRTSLILPVLAVATVLILSGCGGSNSPSGGGGPITFPGNAFSGTVSAGGQPIANAGVKLYAAGTTGDGSAPTALLTSTVTTDSTGAFSIPAGYPCPASSSQLYVVARGGHLGTASDNAAIAFLATLGTCGQLVSSSHVVLNEVTTVANVWALSQFLGNGGNLGASATNTVGLANAVATAVSLANPATGTAPGATFPSNGSSPAAKINTLANLLNTCTRSTSSSTACTNIVFATTSGPALLNPDILDATLRIVRNPASTNIAALYAQSISSIAFAPTLSKAPADWTLFVRFTGAGMNLPTAIAVDSTGSVWVASYFYAASKFSPIGQPVFPLGITGYGLGDTYGMAIDAHDNVWITNTPDPAGGSHSSVTVLNSNGQSLFGTTGITAGGIDYPVAVAIDADSTVWVLDNGDSYLTHLDSSGNSLSGDKGFTSNYYAFPITLAIDASHNVWVANQNKSGVIKGSPDGNTFTNYDISDGSGGIVFDQSGNLWIADYRGDSVVEISSGGNIVSGGFTANGDIYHPNGIAIDGAGNIWVANYFGVPSTNAVYLNELAGVNSTVAAGQPLSPTHGWAPDAGLTGPYGLAIDASGNLWVSNHNDNSITEFVGVAPPVKTPLIGPPKAP